MGTQGLGFLQDPGLDEGGLCTLRRGYSLAGVGIWEGRDKAGSENMDKPWR